jgi:glycosyltransferase involved in cell wall biosynthesis
MKIFFPFIGDTVGGSHVSAILLIRALKPAGYSPVVFLHQPGPLEARLRQEAIDFSSAPVPHYAPSGGRLRSLLHLCMAIPRMVGRLRQAGIGIVHTNDARSLVTWAVPCLLAGARLVHHQRTRFVVSRIPNAALALARAIITISSYNQGSLPAGFRAKAAVVLDPYETGGLAPDRAGSRQRLFGRLGLSADVALVGFVGTLQAQKRPNVFLQAAAAMLRGSDSPMHFVLYGRANSAAHQDLLRQIALLQLDGKVTVAGYVADVEAAIAGLDILLAPAVDEGFGRAVVESMLAAVPVVAADSGGHREALGADADDFLVPPDDPLALAHRALAVLAMPDRGAELGVRLRRNAEAQLSVGAHLRGVTAVYGKVLS